MMQEFRQILEQLFQNMPPIVLWIVTVIFATAILSFLMDLRILRAHNVAVIGFSRAGKTTLITALFGAILDLKIERINARLLNRQTIERVNNGLAQLNQGKRLPSTKDKDMFAYSTNIVLGKWLKKTYRVEIGDYPGVMSEELASGAAEPLLDEDYARWINEAQAFIFVIDMARCLEGDDSHRGINREYVETMTAAFRAAWQNTLNHHAAGERKLKSYPVVLVFTKSDLVNYASQPSEVERKEKIRHYGFEELPGLPGAVEVDPQQFAKQKEVVLNEFSGLRSFFSQASHNYEEVFTSSLGVVNSKRLGFEGLLFAVFPAPPA